MLRSPRTAIVAIVALVAISVIAQFRQDELHGRPRATSSTFTIPGDLAVSGNSTFSGTTDTTGVVTARAGVRLTTPTTGPLITSGSAVPTGTATIGSLYLRTGTAQLYQNTNGGTTWAQVGGSSSTSSLTAPTSTNKDFNTFQTDCNVNLTSAAAHDWIIFSGGIGSTSVWYGFGPENPAGQISNFGAKRGPTGLRKSLSFMGSFTGNSIGAGSFSVTADAGDSTHANTALSFSAASVEMQGTGWYGFEFEVPLTAGESGTLKMCLGHASYGFTVAAQFADGSASPVSTSVANYDAAGGTRGISLVSMAYSNANGGNRMRVQVYTSGTQGPFNGSLWPLYIYY